MLKISHDDMELALHSWFKSGEVFEIRALEATTKAWSTKPHTVSGYFDYDHIKEIPQLIENTFISYKGIYVTINPLNPAVLGRAMNRFKSDKLISAKDDEVIARRWLLIDCDAKRVSGVSSSDEEHSCALQKAQEIKEGLSSIGWPEPIELDSGNGAQLMYRVDLPVQDNGLVKRCLEQLKFASDEHVDIDQTVFNPARLWRLPGAWNCKGDECPEQTRIHRQSRLLHIPEEVKCVSLSTLQAFAPEQETIPCEPVEGNFDIHSFVATHFPEAKATPYAGGTKWVLDTCPFNSDHNDRSAVIIQASDGKLGFRCHHNGCAGKNWHDLRALLDPKEPLPELPKLNLERIVANASKPKNEPSRINEVQKEPKEEDIALLDYDDPSLYPWGRITTEQINKEVLEGTILGEICKLFSLVSDPPLPLEFVILKALALIGVALTEPDVRKDPFTCKGVELAKAKVGTGGGQALNFYGLLAAPSGSGKDIGGLLDHVAFSRGKLIGDSGSAEGLMDAYIDCPNGLLSIPELQNWLDPRHWQHSATHFVVSAFNRGFYIQTLSKRGKNASIDRSISYCYPNIVANVQPETFVRVTTKLDVDNGFLGRFLFVCAPTFNCEPSSFDLTETKRAISSLLNIFFRKEGVANVEKNYAVELKEELNKDRIVNLRSCANRLCNEYYPRLAVILAVTTDPKTHDKELVITEESKTRAKKLVYWFYRNARMLLSRVDDIDPKTRRFEDALRRTLAKIESLCKQKQGKPVTRRDIARHASSNTTSKERLEYLNELVARGYLEEVKSGHYVVIRQMSDW